MKYLIILLLILTSCYKHDSTLDNVILTSSDSSHYFVNIVYGENDLYRIVPYKENKTGLKYGDRLYLNKDSFIVTSEIVSMITFNGVSGASFLACNIRKLN